ncbi:MAG: DUF5305 domain-containing protein [Syntrophomonadaceae bacterium]|nr:DUF5305 domain-containing protein [Syntrophomonadaceae bacterium]
MGKKTINKNTRLGLIVVLALMLAGSTGLTVWWYQQPLEKVKEVPVYTCQQQIQVDYQVFIDPNNFFAEQIIGPGQAYITSLTQDIETTLNYSFSGDAPSDISGQYQVEAVLTGYILKEKPGSQTMEREKVRVWTRAWELLPPTPFFAHDRKLEVKQPVPVDVRSYAFFAEQVARELKFSADVVELAVTYNVQAEALTPRGEVEEPIKAVMLIPLKGASFMVEGMLTDKKEKSITQSETEIVAGVKTARRGFAVAAGVLALLLLLVIFKTTAEIVSPEERILRQIMKKQGDRIVAGFSWVPAISDKNIINLNSFDDLVKVADEVKQPILYEQANTSLHSFYVVNAPLIYRYSLTISPLQNLDAKQSITAPDASTNYKAPRI